MSEKQKPDVPVLILKSIAPEDTAGGGIHSPRLDVALDGPKTPEERRAHRLEEEKTGKEQHVYTEHERELWKAFLEAEPGSLDENMYGKKIAQINIMHNAQMLQTKGRDKALWADRITESTESLYGVIDIPVATSVLDAQRNEISALSDLTPELAEKQSFVMSALDRFRSHETDIATESVGISPEQREELRSELVDLHAPIEEVLATVEGSGPFTPAEAREIARKIFEKYSETVPEFANWKVTNNEGKTQLSMQNEIKELDIPDGRQDFKDRSELIALAYHEIGVHVFRSVNGYSVEDKHLAIGLPQYLDFEEGLGVFAEYVITGDIPKKNGNRYLDIAMATGVLGGEPLDRQTMLKFALDREILRLEAAGQSYDIESIQKEVKTHVDRIFRGGDGKVHENADDSLTQAVFVKDLIYLEGFIKANKFVAEQLDEGVDPAELWAWLLSGKFDPTNSEHRNYLKSKEAQ